MSKSQFIISLDFELLWGVRDKRTIQSYGSNIRGVREVIPSLLSLFNKYGIKASFATVGFLFCPNKASLLNHIPQHLPAYSFIKYSPFGDYLNSVGESEDDDKYHYASTLIQLILDDGNHEIASHTFSHFYCLEKASLEAFKADIIAAQEVANEIGLELNSMVFPRNQYSAEHIEICKELGFSSYRGNETAALYNPRSNEEQSFVTRGLRLLDSYINITGHHTFRLNKNESILNIPASRFLRPYSNRTHLLDSLRLKRIKNSMTHAARKGEAFHLWWHPHNFGINLEDNLSFLNNILQHYHFLNKNFGMRSLTMEQVANEYK
jgi:peptidoglycan/xylan/chitin deacetylase (PgdA/CDA1 family)